MAIMTAKDIVIKRVFDARREQVWKAWTQPDLFKKWWGPRNFTAPHASIDLRVGGKFLYCMRGAGLDGMERDYWNTGEHLEIVPMEKIVASMSFADGKGEVVPASYYGMTGDWPLEIMLTVSFEDIGRGKTEITVREEGIPEEMTDMARLGWHESLAKLDESLKKPD